MAERTSQRRLIQRMLLLCAGAFVFAFSLVPLYRIACTKVFGIKLEAGAAEQGKVDDMAVDLDRWVTIEFDTTVNSKLPWAFGAKQATLKVRPGELYEANFWARNTSEQAIVGQAIPSVAPSTASLYFNKTECFCFTEQLLAAGEQRDMPVRFVVDPALPVTIDTLTLSYTFFENDLATAKLSHAVDTTGGTVTDRSQRLSD